MADPPRMLILQGARGRSAGQDQPGATLRAIVLEEQQEMTGTTRTMGAGRRVKCERFGVCTDGNIKT